MLAGERVLNAMIAYQDRPVNYAVLCQKIGQHLVSGNVSSN